MEGTRRQRTRGDADSKQPSYRFTSLMGVLALCCTAGCAIQDDATADGSDDGTMEAPAGIDSGAVFLLAGQSNMEGNVNRGLYDKLISELESGNSAARPQRLVDHLKAWYKSWPDDYAMYGYSDEMAKLEAAELIRLHGAGLVNKRLAEPYSKVYCTFAQPFADPPRPSTPPKPLELNCGNPFGPELVLGHFLGARINPPTSLIKVAKGGTNLYSDWLPPSAASRTGRPVGRYYGQLRDRIKSLQTTPASVHPDCASKKCRWAGFIWFQGEADSLTKAHADEYQSNLASLISDVRGEIGSAQLPVMIVGMGDWAVSLPAGKTVIDAQKAVVNADPRARFVKTDDLSGFFHYDPAAQLIIGERIGKALVPLLGGSTNDPPIDECPNDPQKTKRGLCDCGVPEGTCGSGTPKCVQEVEDEPPKRAALSCPSGQVIEDISFASWGTPKGTCPNFAKGTYHATGSKPKVRALCLNKQSCTVEASNATFGVPPAGVDRKLAIVYKCSGGVVADK